MAKEMEKSTNTKPNNSARNTKTAKICEPNDKAASCKNTANLKPKKRRFDWEAIEKEFRAGAMSIREIGRQYGPSDMAIRKRAKKLGWKRDLTDEVRRRVRAESVRSPRTDEEQAELEEDAIVEAVKKAVGVVRYQQLQIGEWMQITEQIKNMLKNAKTYKYKNMFGKEITGMYPSHFVALYNAGTIGVCRLIEKQRQAFNLDEHGEPPDAKKEWTSFPNAGEPLTLAEWEDQVNHMSAGRKTNGELNNGDLD